MTDDANSLTITRHFDAPAALIWSLWTEPEHFEEWYGPNGASITVAKMDVRVGGVRLVCMEMSTPDGPMQMWFTGEFLDVLQNERLAYTESMSDEHGNVLSPSDVGMPEGHPVTTEVTVELDDMDGRTRMVVTHAGVPADSPAATGWEMAFDKLTERIDALTGP